MKEKEIIKEEPRTKRSVRIDGEEIPLRCTLEVLEDIQKEFGSIMAFADKLSPVNSLPDAHAVFFALPKFVYEGIRFHNETHPTTEIKEDKFPLSKISRHCDDTFIEVAAILFDVLTGSLFSPKPQPPAETNQE